MRRPSNLGGVPLVEGAPERRDKRRDVGEERIDHLRKEVVASEVAQALERCAVDGPVGAPGRSGRVLSGRPHTVQRFRQHFRANRLRHVVVHSRREASVPVLGQRVRRHRDDAGSRLRPPRADPSRRVETVELRHLHVHQHDVVPATLERLDRFETVRRDVGSVAEPVEQAERDLLVDRIVLGKQDRKR